MNLEVDPSSVKPSDETIIPANSHDSMNLEVDPSSVKPSDEAIIPANSHDSAL